jgi:transposase
VSAFLTPAWVQDRDAGLLLLEQVHARWPSIHHIVADGGYRGPIMAQEFATIADWTLEIVQPKRADAHHFKLLPKRWIVERTFAWFGRCRRLAKDFEHRARIALAFLKLAAIRLLLRRLAR